MCWQDRGCLVEGIFAHGHCFFLDNPLFMGCNLNANVRRTFAKTTWHCSDDELAVQWLRVQVLNCGPRLSSCIGSLKSFQNAFALHRSAADARSNREPPEIKTLREGLRSCADPVQQRSLRKQLFKARIQFLQAKKLAPGIADV